MASHRSSHKSLRPGKLKRQKAIEMLAAGERQSKVARVLGLSRQCVHNWYQNWQAMLAGGRGAPLAGHPPPSPSPTRGEGKGRGSGRKSKLSQEQIDLVDAALRRGPRHYGFASEHWTLWRVATVIAEVTGVQYHPSSVWRILHTLGWKLHRSLSGGEEPGTPKLSVRRHWVAPAKST